MTKQVYFFGGGVAEGHGLGKEVLGGKGHGLAEMTSLGIPVPPGFTITTEVCADYYRLSEKLPDQVQADVRAGIDRIGKLVGAGLGDAENPLLVSVRSGARASMPGMMDTILNLGLNDVTVEAMARRTGDARFAFDAYRRFITMYANVVLGQGRDAYEEVLSHARRTSGAQFDHQVPAETLRELVKEYKRLAGPRFPQDPFQQLWGAIGAVFGSWQNDRAKTYRKLNGIPDEWGTACNVQAMVFGNMGDDCATGVAFTRDGSTGEPGFMGEFLPNAQGEDVVAGIRTPMKLSRRDAERAGVKVSLETLMPGAFAELLGVQERLEGHFKDMQDIEFTIQRGKLWLLQTRNAKRTVRAQVRVAVDLVHEGKIDKVTAVGRVEASRLHELLLPSLDSLTASKARAEGHFLAQGLAASPGYAAGEIVFTADEAVRLSALKKSVILVRRETSPEDIHGMNVAKGILTATGGLTSHAAVIARGMGKCCVAGCSALTVDYDKGTLQVATPKGRRTLKAGDRITLDGTSGQVFEGVLAPSDPTLDPQLDELMAWADSQRRLGVRANADTPKDAEAARRFGAQGIGLCRTEHMFFDPQRIKAMREMILADDQPARRHALEKLLPFQRDDFVGILTAMEGLPVTIRLLDPPLHEFLPQKEADLRAIAIELGITYEAVCARNSALHEANPMLGHRGCRLAVTYPEIYEMQARAIALAAVECVKKKVDVRPEIMIPIVGTREEIRRMRDLVVAAVEKAYDETGVRVAYTVGTMIELPRACIVADDIAHHADFFSFGTNDLTQTTWGLSRDDAGRFLPTYVDDKVIPIDPFVALDTGGVGELMKLAVAKGRGVKPKLKIGICGEHGGEPTSIVFCHSLGLDYVSCSPFRVMTARLAAAQAAASDKK